MDARIMYKDSSNLNIGQSETTYALGHIGLRDVFARDVSH